MNLNVRHKTIELSEENIRENLHDWRLDEDLFDKSS